MSRRDDLLKIDPTGGLFKKLASDKNKDVRNKIAASMYLYKELDPSGESIKQLVLNGDENFKARFMATHNILELDPSGELIKKLASDKSAFIRQQIINRYNIDDLSKLSSNTNESLLRSYIKYLL